jgi:hypothetical protein
MPEALLQLSSEVKRKSVSAKANQAEWWMGETFPAVCGDVVIDSSPSSGQDPRTTVNAYRHCTLLQHMKEAI